MTDVGDEASANRKAMVFMGGLLPGNVLYWAQKCGIHGIVKCIFRVIKDRDVTGRSYSMHKIMQLGFQASISAECVGDVRRQDGLLLRRARASC